MSEIELLNNRGAQLRIKIYELLHRRGHAAETKNILLMAYVDIALEHHESISLLMRSKLFGSAFALARPLFETMFRALWINKCATQDQIEEVANRDDAKFPNIAQMVQLIDQSYSTGPFFTSIKQTGWATMCSYTHSGLLQITRRFTGDIKPNYKDAEILEVLNVTNIAIILLARMFFVSMGCHDEAAEAEKMMLDYGEA